MPGLSHAPIHLQVKSAELGFRLSGLKLTVTPLLASLTIHSAGNISCSSLNTNHS